MCKRIMIMAIAILALINIPHVFSQEEGDVNTILTDLNSKDEARIEKAYNTLTGDHWEIKKEYRQNREIKEAFWNAFTFLAPNPKILRSKSKDLDSPTLAMSLLYHMGDVKEMRAIPYLLANIHDSGVDPVLATMGDSVVDPVLNFLVKGDDAEKRGATVTLKQMLLPKSEPERGRWWDAKKKVVIYSIPNRYAEDYEPAGNVREKIKVTLKKELAAGNSKTKAEVLDAFQYIASEDDLPELDEIAKNDANKSGSGYFVREAAQKIINKIKAKGAEGIKAGALPKSTTAQ